jgi:hypothetical protein
MADIRIKDLTTTASTTAADDFFAADGATNGTRKLSAYSPTFGGNATVTGTLTVNGGGVFTRANTGALAIKSGDAGSYTDISLGRTAAEHFLAIAGSANNYVVGTVAGDCALNASSATAAIFVGVYGNAIGKFTSSGLSIPTTTASNSTSSGALVVGNGTSGGLGVGGALYVGSAGTFGGTVRVSTANGTAATFSLLQAGQQQWAVEIPASTTNLRLRAVDAGVDALTLGTNGSGTFAGAVSISSTTASTGTSSGALVVSGGVGVAGAIFAGGVLSTVSGAGFNTPDWRFYQSGTSGYIRDLVNGQMALQFISGSASTIQVYATGTQDSTTTTSGALISAGGLGVAGAVNAGTFFGLVDGVTAPSTAGGYARIYVDSADGDLKVKFGDGTVKTIATDS